MQMIQRANKAHCFISGLKDYKNQSNGVGFNKILNTFNVFLLFIDILKFEAIKSKELWTGVTLAHCLATYGICEALETIIELDKSAVNQIDDSGFTPLHCAAKFGQIDAIKGFDSKNSFHKSYEIFTRA